MEELSHIVTFTHVVKAGSFSGAARQMRIASSVASKHVTKLERALGVRLLNRNTRKLSLTEAGAAYYEHCTRIVAEVESGRRALAELQAVPRGRLRVTAPVPVASTLGPILQDFLQRHPRVELELDASNRVVDLAAEGYDVAIRFARKLPPNIVARLLTSLRVHAYASPQYLARAGVPEHPAQLSHHNCLNLPTPLPGGVWTFQRGDERVEVTVQGSVQSDMVDTLRDLALAGTGVTLLPTAMTARDVRDGRLTPLLPEWAMPDADLYAVYLPTRHVAPKVRVFVDFLVERFMALGQGRVRASPAKAPPSSAAGTGPGRRATTD